MVLGRAAGVLGRQYKLLGCYNRLDEAVRFIEAHDRLICSGVGKSGHVARKVAATFSSLGKPAYFVHPLDCVHGDGGMVGDDDCVLLFSASGESRELDTPKLLRNSVAICGPGWLSDVCDVHIPLLDLKGDDGPFGAPMLSCLCQMAIGDELACSVSALMGFTSAEFKAGHPGGVLGTEVPAILPDGYVD